MKRAAAGQYVTIATLTERARAFVPAPLPPDPPIEWSQELRSKFDRALLALGRLDAIPTFLPQFSDFITVLHRKEAILSSLSEEKRASFEDLLSFEFDSAQSEANSDVSEVERLCSLIPWIWDRFGAEEPDFLSLVRQAHLILVGDGGDAQQLLPGDFRANQNRLSVTQPGNAAFIPPPADQIDACMKQLQRFLNDRREATPFLVKAALAQAQFELIQPFAVGNSRLARLIPTMLIREYRVLGAPILITSSYFAQHRKEYYDALNSVRSSGDWEVWLGYFADAISASAERSFADIKSLAERVAADTAIVSELGRPAESAIRILRAMVEQPVATSNWLVAKTGITPATVNKSLAHLGEVGVIEEQTSRKRNRVFAYTRYIEILKNDIEGVFA